MMLLKQLFDQETWTYTYLLADPASKDAVLIDPVKTHIDAYVSLLDDLGLHLKYTLETHVHADHLTASGLLRQRLGAQTGVSALCGASTADIQIQAGDVLQFGQGESITVIATPGHTPGSVSYLWRDRVFTGDSLLIGGCGRTDFQGGDPGSQYDGITQRLFTLPDDTLVYPGHDYQQRWVSNIVQERTTNPRLAGKTREEFIAIMQALDLPRPRLIDAAVPANRYCGLDEHERQEAVAHRDVPRETAASQTKPAAKSVLTAQEMLAAAKQHITEVSVASTKALIKDGGVTLIDVREESEVAAGQIANAIPIPRGVLEFRIGNFPELADKNQSIIIYCRSGVRSAMAAQTLQCLGCSSVVSMAGGFEAWQKSA